MQLNFLARPSAYLILFGIVLAWTSYGNAQSAASLASMRVGRHPGFSRLVLTAAGAKPARIGPATEEGLTIVYDRLEISGAPEQMFGAKGGAVARISVDHEDGRVVVSAVFKQSGTAVKYFYLEEESTSDNAYRLVMDFYDPGTRPTGPGTLIPMQATDNPAAAAAPGEGLETRSSAAVSVAATAPALLPSSAEANPTKTEPISADDDDNPADDAAGETAESEDADSGRWSGEIALRANALVSDDGYGSRFTRYGDVNPLSGDWSIRFDQPDRLFFHSTGERLGQADQSISLTGGRFGMFAFDARYKEMPYRSAFDVQTLYSGIGSSDLALDDGLQTDLQDLDGDPAAQAERLTRAILTANSGDPASQRRDGHLAMDLIAWDPFSLHLELGLEDRQGTRPRFGSFGLAHTVELFEPVDSQTIDVRLLAEYAKQNLVLSSEYYFQSFENEADALTFDNPLRLADDWGAPSQGRLAAAPDNMYQSLTLSGSYLGLPLRTQLSASATWGWMRQNDRLLPFTINSALTTPVDYSAAESLPRQRAAAAVDTTQFNVQLASQPLSFFSWKGRYRYDGYDNQTDPMIFPNGYVNSDAYPQTGTSAAQITTSPISFEKTKADLDLGFRLGKPTRLNLTYAYQITDRTNSAVEHQTDHILGSSLDSRPWDWLGLRLSWERTQTDIDDYRYQHYLQSGLDINELPLLRKYNQADVVKNRARIGATFYPGETLSFTGTAAYGRDDFTDSPFGLIEDTYYSFGLDADWSVFERLQLQAYYMFERYDNIQRGQGYFDADSDGLATETIWEAGGRDQVHTLGLSAQVTLIPEKLLAHLSYSYAQMDGWMDFDTPDGSVPSFEHMDDAALQTFDGSLAYRFNKRWHLKLGFKHEKLDYRDEAGSGWTAVPTDGSGAYNGAVLADTLPKSFDAYLIYTLLGFTF